MPENIVALLSEARWLTKLARSLTRDAAEADDVVQETYAAALRSPPEEGRPARPWLRRVLLNAVRMRHRSRTRRVANEEVSEQIREPARTPDELLERARLEQKLNDLVLELDEPYRTTVLLRYREGLTAQAIAQRQGIPAGTVRTRLKTALDRLRRELDEYEDPAQWRAVFVPFALPRSSSPVWRLAMAKTTTKVGVAIAVLLLLAVVGWMWRGHQDARTADSGHARTTVTAPRSVGQPSGASEVAMFAQAGITGRPVTGQVTFHGKPFAGATVHLVHARTETTIAEVKSGADGSFSFGVRAADRYTLTADAADKIAAPVMVDLRAPAAPPPQLRLSGCSHLVGVVLDGSGAPIANARVVRQDAPWPVAMSDVEGRYDLCVRFGGATILYSASGYHGVTSQLSLDALTKHDVVLVPEATVAGMVLTADGTPVPGAWIEIDPFGKNSDRDSIVRGRADADGTFRIAQVAPGRNQLSAVAPGLASRRIEIVVGAGQALEGVIVRVDRAVTITGIVLAGDKPVVGAGVGIRIGNLDKAGSRAVTQADGSFVFDRAPRGDVALYVEGHTVATPRTLHVEDDHVSVKVQVEALGTIRGRVVHDGAPVTDAYISCPGQAAYSDDEGAFTCTGIGPGAYDIVAYEPGGYWGYTGLILGRGETKDIKIGLDHHAAICGKVIDENGKPLRGIDVRALDPKTGDQGHDLTAADGTFCARLLTGNARYQVNAFAGGIRLEPLTPRSDVEVGDGRVDIQLAVVMPRQSIAGTVMDAHGAPIADALVRVDSLDRLGARLLSTRDLTSKAVTDDAGHFEVTRLAPGDYSVLAMGRDGSERTVAPVAAGTRDLTVTLDPAGKIEGRLVDFQTPPLITGILITGAHEPVDAEVDGDRFHASGLSPGTYILTAWTGAREGDTQRVIVRAGQTTTATMTSRGTATVAGRVVDFKKRTPIAGVRCNVITRQGDDVGVIYNGPDSYTLSDAEGRFLVEVAPAGEVLVACTGLAKAVALKGQRTDVVVYMVPPSEVTSSFDAAFSFSLFDHHIAELTKGGVADHAGLAVGDEVIAVDGMPVAELDTRQTSALIRQRPPGTSVTLSIKRGEVAKTITMTVRAPDF